VDFRLPEEEAVFAATAMMEAAFRDNPHFVTTCLYCYWSDDAMKEVYGD